ncbi:hypothetical protein [Pseudonocardia pini]|uniref:hypothetical protein n=1 Tax=Pseudonocardia pini TaxID=2758030 RepID=UPI0015F056E1|nr:hypothetical protein [Pseudonocardia pini]
MSTVRILPLGAPVAAGVLVGGQPGVVALSLAGAVVSLLAIRSAALRLRAARERAE